MMKVYTTITHKLEGREIFNRIILHSVQEKMSPIFIVQTIKASLLHYHP